MNENPFSTIETTLVIAAIIQVTVLIAFFILVSSVDKIKNSVCDNNKSAKSYIDMATMDEFIGRIDLAIENYLRAKFTAQKKLDSLTFNENPTGHITQLILDIDENITRLKNIAK